MRTAATLIMSALLCASAALGADTKTLYVKAHEAKVLKEADAASDELGTVHFGDQVTWLGAAARPFHKVSATVTGPAATSGKKKKGKGGAGERQVEGYLLQQNLTANKPQEEVAGTGEHKLSAQAFASSGAATKAMSEAGLKYAKRKANMDLALKGVMSAEAVAKSVDEPQLVSFGCAVNGGCK